jgi:predicted DCC family thiol-disulfide oxidoreductase YuxK
VTSPPAVLLYDGDCGFCHAWVKVLLRLDRDGRRFRYAPLQGEKAHALLTDEQRRRVGDTVVMVTPEGRILSRSRAVVYILRCLGGGWGVLGGLLWLVPVPLRDLGYDLVARVRHRLFAKPDDACPLLPPDLRARFDP